MVSNCWQFWQVRSRGQSNPSMQRTGLGWSGSTRGATLRLRQVPELV
jgi:hypothetical protein